MAYPYNLSIGSTIFRMQGAEGCGLQLSGFNDLHLKSTLIWWLLVLALTNMLSFSDVLDDIYEYFWWNAWRPGLFASLEDSLKYLAKWLEKAKLGRSFQLSPGSKKNPEQRNSFHHHHLMKRHLRTKWQKYRKLSENLNSLKMFLTFCRLPLDPCCCPPHGSH